MEYTDDGKIEVYFDNVPWNTSIFGELSQYTGLKDKRCKEIYEGDILKFTKWASPSTTICDIVTAEYQIVRYMELGDNPMAGFVVAPYKCGDLDNGIILSSILVSYSKVIGNIFENPELIKR